MYDVFQEISNECFKYCAKSSIRDFLYQPFLVEINVNFWFFKISLVKLKNENRQNLNFVITQSNQTGSIIAIKDKILMYWNILLILTILFFDFTREIFQNQKLTLILSRNGWFWTKKWKILWKNEKKICEKKEKILWKKRKNFVKIFKKSVKKNSYLRLKIICRWVNQLIN